MNPDAIEAIASTIARGQVAFQQVVTIPDAYFDTPMPVVEMELPDTALIQPQVDVMYVEQP